MAHLVQALGAKPADLSISCIGRENKDALLIAPPAHNQHTSFKNNNLNFKKKINQYNVLKDR